MLADLYSYLKLVARSHVRRPGFALVVIFTLALGLGAAVAALGVVINTLFNPLPFRDAHELVTVVSAQPARQAERLSVSYPDFKDWQRLNQVFTEMAAVSNVRPVTWAAGDAQAESLQAEFVSWNFFPMLGVTTSSGRTFEATEDLTPRSHPVVVISHRLWQQRFGGEPVIGREMLLNGLQHQVIGVLEPSYMGYWWESIDLWLPMAMAPAFLGDDYLENRSIHWHLTVARLKPGVSIDRARQEMNAIAAELERRYPVSNEGYRTSVFDQRELYYSLQEDSLWKALIFTCIFLALCCLNISALMLTRGTARRREVAVRSALGASRSRLLAEQIGESVLLASVGGAIGLVIALLGARAMLRFGQLPPASSRFAFDARIFIAAFGLVLLAAVLIALGPVLQTLWSDLWRFLKQGAATTGSRRFRALLNTMIVLEVALATLVLVSAIVTHQSFVELSRAEIGLDSDRLLTARLDLQDASYSEDEVLHRRQLEIVDRVAELPGVEAAGLGGFWSPPKAFLYTDATFEDRLEESSESASLRVYRQYITPGYLAAVGIPLIEGREFDRRDVLGRPQVAIVSQVLAEKVWPGESAIGKRLRRGLPEAHDFPWLTVVGVARTAANRGLRDQGKGPDFDLYLPLLQDRIVSNVLFVRAAEGGDPAELAGLVRDEMRDIDLDIPIYEVATMRERLRDEALAEESLARVMTLFGVLAAVVVAIGLYGVLAYAVRQRLREFGVRVALGAGPQRILRLVLYRGLLLVAGGIALGVVVALQLGSRLPGVQVTSQVVDPLALLTPIAVLFLIGLIGMAVPARRAVRVEPTRVLRQE